MSASHLIETVGWGLVHTSWLFLLPMVALILCRFCFPSASSEAKYWFSLAMLFALPLLAASWIAWTWQSPSLQTVQSSIPDQVNLQPSLALPITDDGVTQIDTLTSIELPAATPEFARTRIPASELLPPVTILPPDSRPLSISQQATELIQPKLPLVVFVWLGGVVLFSVRALLGLRFALRLQHRGLQAVDERRSNDVSPVGQPSRCDAWRESNAVIDCESAMCHWPFRPDCSAASLRADWIESGSVEGDLGSRTRARAATRLLGEHSPNLCRIGVLLSSSGLVPVPSRAFVS